MHTANYYYLLGKEAHLQIRSFSNSIIIHLLVIFHEWEYYILFVIHIIKIDLELLRDFIFTLKHFQRLLKISFKVILEMTKMIFNNFKITQIIA